MKKRKKIFLKTGQQYEDENGNSYKVGRLNSRSITLTTDDGEVLYMKIDDFADELEEGSLALLETEGEEEEVDE